MSFGKFVNHLIDTGKTPTEIYAALVKQGAAPCVAREWSNEPKRRAALYSRRQAKKECKGFPNKACVAIYVFPTPGSKLDKAREKAGLPAREYMLHATKGWRSYRLQDMGQVADSIQNYGHSPRDLPSYCA